MLTGGCKDILCAANEGLAEGGISSSRSYFTVSLVDNSLESDLELERFFF